MANLYGDVELDARGMRALAHPVRLALLRQLQQGGPSTATRLAPVVGASPSVASWHLRHLAEHGLVRDATDEESAREHGRERWWAAVSRGFRFTSADDPEGQAAAAALTRVIEAVEGDLVQTWREESEPFLEPEWRHLSERASTRILATHDELTRLNRAMEELLAPYVLRKDAAADSLPAGIRSVRILRYVLPEAAPGPSPEER